MTDPIADMLTRIRNASLVKKRTAVMPSSNAKVALAKLLVREGWLERYDVRELPGNKRELSLTLAFHKDGTPVITNVRRVSKPSRRVYVKKYELPRVKNDYGMAVISTSKGLMTNKEARSVSLGGEVVCELF